MKTGSMTTIVDVSPTVARRRLRIELRRAREENKLTQSQVADALDGSLSKVQRIETGDVTVSASDLKALLNLYGISDPGRVERLIAYGRVSRRRAEEDHDLKHLTQAMKRLLDFEAAATTIRVYNPALVPGPLQTSAYADVILKNWHDYLTEEDRAARYRIRMRRRANVLGRSNTPAYLLVLDESVLYREVGGSELMAEQLDELLALMAENPKLKLRILPFKGKAHLAMLNPFIVFDLEDGEDEVLYLEAQLIDEIQENRERIKLYRQRFDELWDSSLNEQASVRRIKARAAAMLSSLDGGL